MRQEGKKRSRNEDEDDEGWPTAEEARQDVAVVTAVQVASQQAGLHMEQLRGVVATMADEMRRQQEQQVKALQEQQQRQEAQQRQQEAQLRAIQEMLPPSSRPSAAHHPYYTLARHKRKTRLPRKAHSRVPGES